MDANSNLRQTHHLQQSVNGVGRKNILKTEVVPRQITPAEFNNWMNYIHRQRR